MKEYKSISIITKNVFNLGDRLNEYSIEGWKIKDTITNGVPSGNEVEFIYLLERDTKIWKVCFASEGYEDCFKEYIGNDKDDIFKMADVDPDMKGLFVKYIHEA